MKSTRNMLGGTVFLALLAMPALVKADEQAWPITVPTYSERHSTMPPVTLHDPTVSTTSAIQGGSTAILVQDTGPQSGAVVLTSDAPPVPPPDTNPPADANRTAEPVTPPQPAEKGCADEAACGCDGSSCCCNCCAPMFEHRTAVYGEYLYLRAFNVDMTQGIQENFSGGIGTAPAGEVGTCQPNFSSGYRVGAQWACTPCSDVAVTYTQYDSSTNNFLPSNPNIGSTAASLVLIPTLVTNPVTFDSLFATYDINFKTADIDYSTVLCGGDCAQANFVMGFRYAHLEQDFSQDAEVTANSQFTSTSINFDGVGIRTGLTGEWKVCRSGFSLYGRSYLDVLFGDFRSNYSQFDIDTSTQLASTHWDDGRVMPILETEFGLEWTSCSGCCRFSVGYMSQYWFNAVDTAEFIQAIQNQYEPGSNTQNQTPISRVGQTIAFTGLSARAEYRF